MPLLSELKKLNQNPAREMQFSLAQIAKSIQDKLEREMDGLVERKVKEAVSQIRVRDGRDGKDAVAVDGKPPTKKELTSLIKSVLPEEKELEIERIKGLQDLLNSLSNRLSNIRVKKGGAKGGGSTVIMDDLTSQVDSSTRTYTLTKKVGAPLIVASTQFPTILRPTIDYVASGTTLTIDDDIGPIQTDQTLIFIYIEG